MARYRRVIWHRWGPTTRVWRAVRGLKLLTWTDLDPERNVATATIKTYTLASGVNRCRGWYRTPQKSGKRTGPGSHETGCADVRSPPSRSATSWARTSHLLPGGSQSAEVARRWLDSPGRRYQATTMAKHSAQWSSACSRTGVPWRSVEVRTPAMEAWVAGWQNCIRRSCAASMNLFRMSGPRSRPTTFPPNGCVQGRQSRQGELNPRPRRARCWGTTQFTSHGSLPVRPAGYLAEHDHFRRQDVPTFCPHFVARERDATLSIVAITPGQSAS